MDSPSTYVQGLWQPNAGPSLQEQKTLRVQQGLQKVLPPGKVGVDPAVQRFGLLRQAVVGRGHAGETGSGYGIYAQRFNPDGTKKYK